MSDLSPDTEVGARPAKGAHSSARSTSESKGKALASSPNSTAEREIAIAMATSIHGPFKNGGTTLAKLAERAAQPGSVKGADPFVLGTFAGNRRRGEDLVSRSGITLDYDRASWATWDRALALGWAVLLYTTHSSTEHEPHFRVLVPTDREMTGEEYSAATRGAAELIGTEGLDPASYSPVQAMYSPTVDPAHRSEHRSAVVDGPSAPVDELIAAAPPDEVRVLRSALKRDPFELPGVVGAFNRAYPPEEAIGTFELPYERVAEGLWTLRGSTHEPGVREVTPGIIYSHHGTDPAYAQALSAFDLVRVHLYGDLDSPDDRRLPPTDRPSAAALREQVGSDPRVLEEFLGEDFPEVEEDPGPYGEVFTASPVLAQVHAAAHSRMVSAPGLLAYVLGRVLGETPPRVKLPAVIGSPASLNLGVAVVAGSGGGKSALTEVSREVLGTVGHEQVFIERSPGSGEGLTETYLETTGKGQQRTKQLIADPRRVMIVDEIGALGAVQGRNGATIAPTIRTAITGGPLGQENATAETRRRVPAGTYRLVMFAGVQPTRSDVLLDDADAGTPQRFLWVPATDPTIPRPEDVPEWPGPLDWELPETDPSGFIDYPEAVKDQVRRDRWQQMRGKDDSGLRGHINLTRLKVAAGLALLHGEGEISERWWRIAGLIVDASMALQEQCRAELSRETERERRSLGRLDAIRQEGAAAVRDEKLTRAAKALHRTVLRHATDDAAPNRKHDRGEGCTARCLTYALRNYRAEGEEFRDRAISAAEAEDWIERKEDRWTPGGSRPA